MICLLSMPSLTNTNRQMQKALSQDHGIASSNLQVEKHNEPLKIHIKTEKRNIKMKLSARNQIKGKIVEVKPGAVNASVTLDIGSGNTINASITMVSVQNLDLKVGDDAYAIIKATSVMIGKD